MYEAASVGDSIGHSQALAGMILGTVVGGLIAAAGAAVATSLFAAGMAASCLGVGVLLCGASLVVGFLTAELATSVRDRIADAGAAGMSRTGDIITGSASVFINGRQAAVATHSTLACDRDGTQQMAEGSSRVYINGLPAVRTGDRTTCGGKVMTGSGNVYIGGEAVQTLPVQPEVPEWLYKVSDLTLLFAGILGGMGGASARAPGALSKLLAKIPGINKLSRLVCQASKLEILAAVVGIIARPVDIVSGQKFLAGDDDLDFVLPSRLPVRWQRYWRSGNPDSGVTGYGWRLFWETQLEYYQDGLVWRAPSGDYIAFPSVPAGYRTFCETEKVWLEHHQDDTWSVYDISGERWHFPSLNDAGFSLPLCFTEPCGNDILFEWNDDRSLASLTDSAGQRVVCRYQRVAGHLRLSGAWLYDEICLVSYTYDDKGRLMTVTGRGGQVRRRFEWYDEGDGAGLLRSHEDGNGLLSEYEWRTIQGLPRVVTFRHNAGEQFNIEYDFDNGIRRAIREDGVQACWLIEGDDNVARFTDFDGRQTCLIHHDGELCDVILPDGAIYHSEWDRYGRMTAETDPAERTTKYYWYRNTDRPVRIVYPDGTTWQAVYDLNGRLLSECDALNHTTVYHYPDAEDTLPERITDARGGDVLLKWNNQGLLTQKTDCSGSVTRFTYDRFGQLISSRDAEGHTVRREWNSAGQLTAVIRADNSRETLVWNEHGQLAAWRDSREHEVSWKYNRLGQPLSQTDRNGITRRWHYDARGNLLRLENGNGADYRFTYDPVGRLLSEVRPDNTRREMTWNERGLLYCLKESGRPDNEGYASRRIQTFSYDESGRLLRRTTHDATYDYRWDPAGRLSRLTRTPGTAGRAAGIEDDEIRFTYDAAGNLLSEAGVNGEVHYVRDELDNLSQLTLPGGQRLAWLRYGAGHVSGIRFNQQMLSEFTRDHLHREITRSQGARVQYREYDSQGRRTQQYSRGDVSPEQQIFRRFYRYDSSHNLVGVSDSLRGEIQYTYDAEGRLLKHYESRQGHSTVMFSYDAADNLRAEGGEAVRDNRLRHWQNLFMKYDEWGNLVSRRSGLSQQNYVYDAENRLIQASGDGPEGRFIARYSYDAAGRRICKRVTTQQGGSEIRFLWQGYRLLQEQQDNGQRRTYIYDPTETYSPLARIDHTETGSTGEIYWFSTDLNSAPLEVTDESGCLRWSGQYGSFGAIRRQAEGAYRISGYRTLQHQPLRYAGQYADSETGLHYNLNRYYDPDCGRFISQDPIGLNGGLNLYAYAPNPLGWIDPLGLALTGVDFTGSPDLFPVKGNQLNIVEITMQGSRGRDFTEAFKKAGITKAESTGYTWHHLNDFDPTTGNTTMQLVKTSAHEGTFPHAGSVSQFEKHFNLPSGTYGSSDAIAISHSKGWLAGRIPKALKKGCS